MARRKSDSFWATGNAPEATVEEKVVAAASVRAAFGRPAKLKGIPTEYHALYMATYEEHLSYVA